MEQKMIPLSRVPEGRAARVVRLLTTGEMRRRLQDIGLIQIGRASCRERV